MRALLLIDIQNDFLPGGSLAVRGGDAIIPIVNAMQDRFELILATQDWHPANHGSFAANHPGKKVGDHIELDGLDQILWPIHCVQNARGAELSPQLRTDRIAHLIYKGTDPNIDSYSAFFDNGHGKATGLADYLRTRDVSEVFLAGLATDYCVKFSALDAKQLRFATTVIEDACGAVNLAPTDEHDALDAMRTAGVAVIGSSEL